MKNNEYEVWFTNGNYEPQMVNVFASCMSDAVILAQAQRIMAGLDKTLYGINEVN